MAAYLKCTSQSGQTIYAVIHDASGQYWNGSSFEAFNSANWATYLNLLTEDGTTGYYKAMFPATITAGYYDYIYYASTTYGDPNIGGNAIYFDGTSEEQGIGAVLKTYLLDKLAKVTAAGVPATIGSFLDLIMNKNSGQTFDQSTDSLEAIVDGGSSGPSAATIAAAVWDEAMAGHVTAGTSGVDLKAIIAALPVSGSISNFDPTLQTVNLGASQTGVTIGTVNALGSSALASVLTQIRTALSSDSMTELVSVPDSTPTIYQALMLSYMSLRNEHTATSNEESIKNNAGTVIATATLSDDGTTYTKGQLT